MTYKYIFPFITNHKCTSSDGQMYPWDSAPQPTCRGTPVCRETMLSVSGKIILSENMSIEFANSNPSYTSTVCLCCYCDIRIEVFTTTW